MARFAPEFDAPAAPAAPVRTNKYAAPCVDCGVRVEAEAGTLTKGASGKWEVKHIKPCPEVVPAVTETVTVTPKNDLPSPVFDGIYTLVHGGSEAHRTIRIRVQDKDDSFKPGIQLVGYLTGPNNEEDYTNIGEITKAGAFRVWSKHASKTDLVADVLNMLTDTQAKIDSEQVLLAARCFRCRRLLTVPTSVSDGLGPECAKKGY